MPIDDSRPFIPVRIAVLTVSDTRTFEDDRSGDTLAARIEAAGHVLADRAIVTDDTDLIVEQMAAWVEEPHIDVIISTGGTGVTGRDVTPEAVESICDKIIPGFGELFRWLSFAKIGTSTLQSRAIGGVAARAVRAGQMASVLEAEARQGETLVATARALFSGVPAEQGEVHRFG